MDASANSTINQRVDCRAQLDPDRVELADGMDAQYDRDRGESADGAIHWRDSGTPTSATDFAPTVTVFHRLFGVGTVLHASGKFIWVRFIRCTTSDDVAVLDAAVARATGMLVAVRPLSEATPEPSSLRSPIISGAELVAASNV